MNKKMIQRIILIVILIYTTLLVYGQGLINNGSKIKITSGSVVFIVGGSNGNLLNSGVGEIDSDGKIKLQGNWINNSSTTVFNNIDNIGMVELNGNTLQAIKGSQLTNFENVTINNSGVGVGLIQNAKIEFELNMTDGDLDLNNYNIQLVDATSTILNETSDKRIKATNGVSDGVGTGTIFTIRNNPSGNVANMGLTIPSITGLITITRGHEKQLGTGGYGLNSSVFRYFKVSPVINGGSGMSVSFNECFTPELNNHNAGSLIMYHWISTSTAFTPQYWSQLHSIGEPVAITKTLNSSTLDFMKVTLGSESMPLPVEMHDFKAVCVGNNKVLISWETLSEVNSDYYTIEKSFNAIDFFPIGIIDGKGYSNNITEYEMSDNYESLNPIYYKLKQIDEDGYVTEYEKIALSCTVNPENEFAYSINQNENEYIIQIMGQCGEQYLIQICDAIGRIIIVEQGVLYNDTKNVVVNKSILNGVYNILIKSNSITYSTKILYIK